MSTYQRYNLTTAPNGRIVGDCETNDNLDKGEPGEFASWPVSYRDYAHMAKSTGLTHVGVIGCEVTVLLDGRRI